ncbi:MAG: 16S rRNA (uracil(1498)-N(3))-methyltransferase [Alloprevotella sp.]|nr:16S rRNA (uracil(1498)-N(3))-methyltransferase [Alloprevotella sp.]
MKEYHVFYAPELPENTWLPAEEAAHAVRVLRMREGDAVRATDGRGNVYSGRLAEASQKRCRMEISDVEAQPPTWHGRIELAVAPTKNMDRMEWLAEKTTEVGVDEIVFLDCRNSERRVVKTERVEKIVVSAMKQSHKSRKPRVTDMTRFADYVARPFAGQRFICHCYEDGDVGTAAPHLFDVLKPEGDAQVLIGPEGDFTLDEVKLAIRSGFRPVTLGTSRLRTETAALCAVHMMFLRKAAT